MGCFGQSKLELGTLQVECVNAWAGVDRDLERCVQRSFEILRWILSR